MISELALKFGPTVSSPQLVLKPTPITVFVGPNNSGKSKIISEIQHQCVNGLVNRSDVILDRITFDPIGTDHSMAYFKRIETSPFIDSAGSEFMHIGEHGNSHQIHIPTAVKAMSDPNNMDLRNQYSQVYARRHTLVIGGSNRTELANDQSGGDLQFPPITSLQKLFRDDALRSRFSSTIKRSFGAHAVIDPTNLGQLRLRLSRNAPPNALVERGLDEASIEFHRSTQHIMQASDGAKAFTGILSQIMAGDPKIILIDEPEAFLHPSLAFNLGREITQSLLDSDKRMFVSTHSPQFLMGCIQSGVPVNVVRLTYRDGVATARLLPSDEIVRLMRNPLLRSTGVLSALFYESVVVTEADPDRAFYQEINERLLRHDRGIPNCIFLNAQNKQTIPTILAPLRSLGIPAAAIYDIDLVKDGGSVATSFMSTAGIPEIVRNGLNATRAALAKALLEADPHYKRNGGIRVLEDAEKAAANDYFDQLGAYGAFVVRGGELESWLKELGATGHGPPWLIAIFEKMGEDPKSATYVDAKNDDVWSFIEAVSAWLTDPQRKGV